MKRIDFSYNWNNKLLCKAFTTIRLHNPMRYTVGDVFGIYLNNRFMGEAVLKSKRTIRHDKLNEFVSYLDTGYNLEKMAGIFTNMYKNIDLSTAYFDLCLLVYVKKA